MSDENSVTSAPFQLDIEGLVSWIYAHLTGSDGNLESLYGTAAAWWYVFSIISFAISALLLVGTVYAMIRFSELRRIEEEQLREAERAYRHAHAAAGEESRWQRIIAHTASESPNDWRIAVMEADIMLDALLDSLGYIGASIAEKLKTAQPGAFRSIEDAWEAHKVRNAIAHRGSDFVLTKRATQETIAHYRRVFEEFKVV